jgi:hypothetical protein
MSRWEMTRKPQRRTVKNAMSEEKRKGKNTLSRSDRGAFLGWTDRRARSG